MSATGKLLKEYTALAPEYDRRWSSYLRETLRMTLEVAGELPARCVLDVACGTGLLLEMLAGREDDSRLVGIDVVPAMLDEARGRLGERATLLLGEAERLPFDDAAFDLVLSTNALHYFLDAEAALLEFRRVISPAGNLVITDWCRDYFWMTLLDIALPWTSHAHTHTFSTGELERSLAKAGFETVQTSRKKVGWFWGLMVVHAVPVQAGAA